MTFGARAALTVSAAVLVAGLVPATAALGASEPAPTAQRVLTPEQLPPASGTHRALPLNVPLRVPDPAQLRREKRDAAERATGQGLGRTPLAPESGTLPPAAAVANGLNALGLTAGTRSPPDSTGAIGPSHYLEMVNSELGVFGRANLVAQATADLDDFVDSPGNSVFDPQVQWDEQAQRWLYVAIDVVAPGDNFLALGWSQTASPTPLNGITGWCNFFIDTDDELEDYPKLGHNDNHIILGTNVFDDSGGMDDGDFLTSRIWAIDKPANGDTTCTAPSAFFFGSPGIPLTSADGDLVFTPVPANAAGSAADGFIVAADTPLIAPNRTQIMGWHISGPGATPVLTADGNMTVSTFNVPANVPQPGTADTLDSLDSRLTQAVSVTNPAVGEQSVWTQHTIAGAGGRSEARWYELLPDSTTVRQQGTISNPSDFIFNAAISPTSSGDRAAINFNAGSSSVFAELRAQSRNGGTALGQMGFETTLGTSQVADQGFTCALNPVGVCRWGDYAGASPDPNDSTLVWGSNQLNGPLTSDPHWVTRNFALDTDDPVPPIVVDIPPDLSLTGNRRQENFRRIKVKVSSDQAVSVAATGRIRVPTVRGGSSSVQSAKTRKFKLRSASTNLTAGQTKTLKLKLRSNARKRVKRALRRGKTSRATIKATATNAAGLSDDAKRKIRLRR